jgi:voltage-gated potassium channel
VKIKEKIYRIIFETDTPAARGFDVILLWLIVGSVFVVMMESIPEMDRRYGVWFYTAEWIFTILFSIEYLIRIWVSPKPLKYITSFWGLVDFLSVLPAYLSYFLAGHHYLLVMRIFRLLRVFRILKLARFSSEAQLLMTAIKASGYKIGIFIFVVLTIVTIMGTVMYVVEGGQQGFTSIPQSIYWAIVTVTTVGYGDMVPSTVLGKFISSICMITGYAIIAVPTGIVTVAMTQAGIRRRKCPHCDHPNELDARYCNKCGKNLV